MSYRTTKLLSVDPSSYKDAPTEGIRRILEEESGVPHPRGQPVDTSRILSIRMGTTVCCWSQFTFKSSSLCHHARQQATSSLR